MIGALIAKREVLNSLEALNKRDLDSFLENWSDDAVLIYPGDIVGISGTFSGKEAIRAFYQRDFKQFPALKITPKYVAVSNFFDMTGNNVLIVQWDAYATNCEGFQIENSGISVMKIQGGKAVHVQQYIFDIGEKFRTAWGQGEMKSTEPENH